VVGSLCVKLLSKLRWASTALIYHGKTEAGICIYWLLQTWICFSRSKRWNGATVRVMLRNRFSRISQEAKLRRHLKQKYVKYVDENLEFFKKKKHQASSSPTYRPSTSGVQAYSHSKAVRASFHVARKNARAKALYAAEWAWSNQQPWK